MKRMFTSGFITGSQGMLAYDAYRSSNAEALVVFATGRAEYTKKFGHLPALFPPSWDMIFYDHPGQGLSEGTRIHATDFDVEHVADLAVIIDTFADTEKPLFLIGHSLGGFVVTRYLELFPGRAAAAAVSAPMYGMVLPAPGWLTRIVAAIACRMGYGKQPSAKQKQRKPCFEKQSTHDEKLYNAFKDDPHMLSEPPTWGWLHAAFTGIDRLFADAGKITEPLLLLQAGYDNRVINSAHDVFIEKLNAIGRIQALKRQFPGLWHELFCETERAVVVKETVQFLKLNQTNNPE